jgi:Lrp/AsnC family transcriptional regulator, leucine-responsive regulatory protein
VAAGACPGLPADGQRDRGGDRERPAAEAEHDRHDQRRGPLLAIPAIVACYLVSGTSDFLVEAAVPDLASYERLLLGQILTIPSVVEAQSTFAIRTILSRGPLPLDHWRR